MKAEKKDCCIYVLFSCYAVCIFIGEKKETTTTTTTTKKKTEFGGGEGGGEGQEQRDRKAKF